MKKIILLVMSFVVLLTIFPVSSFAESSEAVSVNAKAYVLMDASTGEVLLSKEENKKLYPASVTKIMPILLVFEALKDKKISLDDVVTASAEAAAKGGSQIWLKEGEQMKVEELLRAAVIASANDACTALGEYIAGSETGIVKMMNEKAEELGMKNTNFENCTGLDDDTVNHFTTALDIALMSKELLSYDEITNYSTVWMDSLRNGSTQLVNTNKLVRFYKGTTGLKTGTTSKAGYCISASAKRNGLHLIAVVMGSDNSTDRFEGAKALLNYGFSNFETVTPKIDDNLIAPVNIIKGIENSFIPKLEEIKPVTLKTGEKNNIETEIQLSADVEAPVEKGQMVGRVIFKVKNKVIGEYKLFCEKEIRRLKITDIMLRLVSSITLNS
ncbi:MAG: D-alanyl-D-alanine carboxypeptidase [Clostridia bacterium]|nr:D-alanyl-D-alanine carboxypeptidase [Clostridia bacterium]